MSPGRKTKKQISCKKCGYIINPIQHPPDKTWQLISPMPDKEGRVTLTIMGAFRCPECNASVRTAIKKIRGDEIGSGQSKKELLIQAVNLIKEPTNIENIEIEGISAASVEKAIGLLIEQGQLKGKIQNAKYYPRT